MESTSGKDGESSSSGSAMEMEPVTVVVAESSVREPVESAVMTEGSSAPVRSTVYVADVVSVPSEALTVKESAAESPSSSASTAEESGV